MSLPQDSLVDNWIKRSFTSESDHNDLIQRLCEEVRGFDYADNISKAAYNAPSDIPGLNKIVAIDLRRHVVRVEANMTMESLVSALLPFHFLPKVVFS